MIDVSDILAGPADGADRLARHLGLDPSPRKDEPEEERRWRVAVAIVRERWRQRG